MKKIKKISILLILILIVLCVFAVPLPWALCAGADSPINYDPQETGRTVTELVEFDLNKDYSAYRIAIKCKCQKGEIQFRTVAQQDGKQQELDTYTFAQDGEYTARIPRGTKGTLQLKYTYTIDHANSFSVELQGRNHILRAARKWMREKIQERKERNEA